MDKGLNTGTREYRDQILVHQGKDISFGDSSFAALTDTLLLGALAKVGDRLPSNAVIMTGAKSGAGLTFRDNSRVSVGPNARLALARYDFEPGRNTENVALETKLDQGAAAFVSGRVTKRKPGAMKVKTPAALLGVRGTTFVAVTGAPLDQ